MKMTPAYKQWSENLEDGQYLVYCEWLDQFKLADYHKNPVEVCGGGTAHWTETILESDRKLHTYMVPNVLYYTKLTSPEPEQYTEEEEE